MVRTEQLIPSQVTISYPGSPPTRFASGLYHEITFNPFPDGWRRVGALIALTRHEDLASVLMLLAAR
jgi:hypothetical protein